MDKILQQVLQVQSESYNVKEMNRLIRYIVSTIPGCKFKENNGNLYVTKGKADNYNCIVSHTDTVHRIIPKQHYKVLETDGRVFAYDTEKSKLTGIGGDDKVGIAICLHALQQLDNLKVVFFRDEEVGGLGSQKADMKFFDDCNYILQCDRKGNNGIVSNIYGEIMFDDNFGKAIEGITGKYGYKEVEGMFTDVYQLVVNGLEIACANIECGYYNPHQDNEYIVLADYQRCMGMVLEILSSVNERYEVDRTYIPVQYQGQGGWYSHWDEYADYCWECGEYETLHEQEMLCQKCMAKYMGDVEDTIVEKKSRKALELFPDMRI
jgi:tripeptide aminopeptidase